MKINAEPIARRTTTDQVFESLHKWIVSGSFKPGDILPAQDELAKQFKVSRNTLREAMFKLSALGLVQSKQGVGTVVQSSMPSGYLGSISDHLLLDSISITEFIEARLFTERTIAGLCVVRATEKDIADLEQLLVKQKKALIKGKDELFNSYDMEFHFNLGVICGNSVIFKFFEASYELLKKFANKSYLVPGNIELAYQGHSKILEAIKERDVEYAEREMVSHIKDIALRTIDFLGFKLDYELP